MLGAPVQLVLQNPDIDKIAAQQEVIMGWMKGQKEFVGVNTNLKMNKPQVNVTVNRDKASQLGISVSDISNSMRFLLGEPEIAEIERQSERYEVITEAVGKGKMIPEYINSIYLRSSGGQLVSLGNLVNVEETIGPSEIHHFNRLRSANISASTPSQVALGDAMDTLKNYLDEHLPADFEYRFSGEARDSQESFHNLSITVVFSIIFIYLVLAAQFESFIHPFTILLSLPLALAGAFGALYIFGMPFGIVAFIGFIMLLGMVTKNAILLVDYSNVLIARGNHFIDAAQMAAKRRFRPVIMTTISTVLGITPIAPGYGAGGESRAPMGVAVFWGLLVASALTLLVIPVVFTLIHQAKEKTLALISGRSRTAKEEVQP